MSYEIVKASYDRCCESGDFFETFYEIFLSKSPEIAEKFKNTDFKKQKSHIKASIAMMIRLGKGDAKAYEAIERVGVSHSKSQFDIEPRFYELWFDSFCEAAVKHDKEWNEKLKLIWKERLQDGIKVITDKY